VDAAGPVRASVRDEYMEGAHITGAGGAWLALGAAARNRRRLTRPGHAQMAGLNPDVSKWDVMDVGKWLESRGLAEQLKVFKDNDVNGNLLLRLDKDTLVQELHLSETVALQILDEINVQENKMFSVEEWSEDDVVSWIQVPKYVYIYVYVWVWVWVWVCVCVCVYCSRS
jgi:hypothetical protein